MIVADRVWALLRAGWSARRARPACVPWLLHGAALALLPWLHTRFALLAGSLGALVLLRLAPTPNPAAKAVAFLSVPAVSACCWIGFFLAIYGRRRSVSAVRRRRASSPSRSFREARRPAVRSAIRTHRQRPGAPVGVIGLILMMRLRRSQDAGADGLADRRLAFELLFVLVPYLLTATSYAMWWAGWSAPARFANPAVLTLAIPAHSRGRACAIAARGTLAALLLVFGAWLSFVLVSPTADGSRTTRARRQRSGWIGHRAWRRSARGCPSGSGTGGTVRPRPGRLVRRDAGGVVCACPFFVARAPRALTLRDSRRLRSSLLGAMAALTVVWMLQGSDGVSAAPAQLDLLRRIAGGERAVATEVQLPPRLLDRRDLLSMIRIESGESRDRRRRRRNEQPIAALPGLPAGTYRVLARTRGPGGWVILGVGQDQFALRSGPLPFPPAAIEIELPVDVRALVVRGDEEARRTIRVGRRGAEGDRPSARRGLTDRVARRAVNYDGAAVYFLDERAFPEPDGVLGWRGARGRVRRAARRFARPRSLLLRNAPVENVVSVCVRAMARGIDARARRRTALEIPVAAIAHRRDGDGREPSRDSALGDGASAAATDRFLGVGSRSVERASVQNRTTAAEIDPSELQVAVSVSTL